MDWVPKINGLWQIEQGFSSFFASFLAYVFKDFSKWSMHKTNFSADFRVPDLSLSVYEEFS